MVHKTLFDKELAKTGFRVAIFGSTRVKKGDKTYAVVYRLAKMIGHEGIDIVTGGGPGLMEADSTGHAAGSKGTNNSHTLGLLIKLPKKQRTSKNLDIKHEFSKFSERLDTFMSLSNAVVVASGGLGTLLELVYTWQLAQVKNLCNTPIILLGDQWPDFIKWIKRWPLKHKFMSERDLEYIFSAKTCDDAMQILAEAHDLYKKGDKNLCLNIKKYKVD